MVWLPAGDLPPLAQRLERRKQPSLLLHGTVDSWDFPTTLLAPSPIQSVFRRSRHNTIDEKDKNADDGPNERTADAGQSKEPNNATTETERETIPTSATDSPPESRPPLFQTPSNGVGYVATSAAGSRPPSAAKTWTSPALPAPAPASSSSPISFSVSNSSNQTSSSSPHSSPSLWRRIRRSTGHSDDRRGMGMKHFH